MELTGLGLAVSMLVGDVCRSPCSSIVVVPALNPGASAMAESTGAEGMKVTVVGTLLIALVLAVLAFVFRQITRLTDKNSGVDLGRRRARWRVRPNRLSTQLNAG